MEVFVLFAYLEAGTEPAWTYFDSDKCWEDAAVVQQEYGVPADCRTAVINGTVMMDASSLYKTEPQIRPRPRPEVVPND